MCCHLSTHTLKSKKKKAKMSSSSGKKRKSGDTGSSTTRHSSIVDMILITDPEVLAEQVEPSKAIQLFEKLKDTADKLERRLRGDNFNLCYVCRSQSSSDGSRCSCNLHWFCSNCCNSEVDRCHCENVILCRHCLTNDPEPCVCMQGS